jgi:ATP-dependent DNA helicase DinG
MRGNGDRCAAGADASVGTLISFIQSHGFSIPPDEWTMSDDLAARRLENSPVPPAYLRTLAERCPEASGTPVLEALLRLGRITACGGAPERSDTGVQARPRERARTRTGEIPTLEDAFSRIFSALGEERSGQREMARIVAQALEEGAFALLEAGTGTGKSIGYLVPLVLHSLETGERVVVSTYTKNLQDQLYRKEMPLLESALGIGASARRLLGRENYLCTRRVLVQLSRMGDRSLGKALAFGLAIALGGEGTTDSLCMPPDGTASSSLVAPSRCPMNACAWAERCPLTRARKGAREARVLFVNHALVLTDYRQGGTILGPYSKVVFDEAHRLEQCAVDNLSVRVAREKLAAALEPMLESREDEAWKLLLHELEASSPAGNFKRFKRDLTRKAKALERAYEGLFCGIEDSVDAERRAKATRIRYLDGSETFAGISSMLNDIFFLFNEFCELCKLLQDVRGKHDLSGLQQEISCAIDEVRELSEALRFLTAGRDEESVFWLEWRRDGALKEVCGSPLRVDRAFADYLESLGGSAVFTSATISHEGGFRLFKERLGLGLLHAKPIEAIIPSPFPFDDNCLVLVASGLGDPNGEPFAASVARIVGAISRKVARRTLVLFTSYRLCFAVADALTEAGIDGPVFVQGAGESREIVSGRFRRSRSGVLLGVASFWEGVDFPGEELEVLVIPKLPFPVPSEPFVEARSQRLSALGEDPFESLFLSEAMTRMRQGAGRLIRRMDDRGVVVILDSRLGTRPYGARILSALPSKNVVHIAAEECAERTAEWFEKS